MPIIKESCWFVPLVELNNPEGARLQTTYSAIAAGDQLLEEDDAFTISLESFCINAKLDEQTGNDLLARSRVRYGNEPPTEAINFFKLNVPPGEVQENLEFEHIYGREGHTSNFRLWLEIEIKEIDKGLRDNGDLISSSLRTIQGQFGAVFPTLIPFSSVANTVVGFLAKLLTPQAQDVVAFKNQVDLHSLFSEGEAKLRCGAYVFFNEPVEGAQYRLRGLRLEYFTPSARGTAVVDDFVVIKIVPGLMALGNDQDLRRNQQLATILNHAKSDDDPSVRVMQREVLGDFVTDALKFRDLQRLLELKMRQRLGQLNAKQQERLFTLGMRLRDVANFLS